MRKLTVARFCIRIIIVMVLCIWIIPVCVNAPIEAQAAEE